MSTFSLASAPTRATTSFDLKLNDAVIIPVKLFAANEKAKSPLEEVTGVKAPAKASEAAVKATTGRKVPKNAVYKVGTASTGVAVRITADEQSDAVVCAERPSGAVTRIVSTADFVENFVVKSAKYLVPDTSVKAGGEINGRAFRALIDSLSATGSVALIELRPKANSPLGLYALDSAGNLSELYWADEVRQRPELGDIRPTDADVRNVLDIVNSLPQGLEGYDAADPGARALRDLIENKAANGIDVVEVAKAVGA